MAKVPALTPFNIKEYAKRNKFHLSNPIHMRDNSDIYLLSKSNKVQCLNVDKQGQIIGGKCFSYIRNLSDELENIIERIRRN